MATVNHLSSFPTLVAKYIHEKRQWISIKKRRVKISLWCKTWVSPGDWKKFVYSIKLNYAVLRTLTLSKNALLAKWFVCDVKAKKEQHMQILL